MPEPSFQSFSHQPALSEDILPVLKRPFRYPWDTWGRTRKRAFLIKGYDADRFFIELSTKLGCFPPQLVSKPLSHVESCLAMLTDFPLADTGQKDVMSDAMGKIRMAKVEIEDVPDRAAEALKLLMAGEYEKVLEFKDRAGANPDLADTIAWAYIGLGNALSDQAKTKSGPEADRLFDLAGQKYDAALKIKPDYHKALYNWGIALYAQAKTKSGPEAEHLYDKAAEKLMECEGIKEGRAAYDLACVAALRGKEDECRSWITKSKEFGFLPKMDHLKTDTDLDSMRDKQWFIDFMVELETDAPNG